MQSAHSNRAADLALAMRRFICGLGERTKNMMLLVGRTQRRQTVQRVIAYLMKTQTTTLRDVIDIVIDVGWVDDTIALYTNRTLDYMTVAITHTTSKQPVIPCRAQRLLVPHVLHSVPLAVYVAVCVIWLAVCFSRKHVRYFRICAYDVDSNVANVNCWLWMHECCVILRSGRNRLGEYANTVKELTAQRDCCVLRVGFNIDVDTDGDDTLGETKKSARKNACGTA